MAKEIVVWCECDLDQDDQRVPGSEHEVSLDGKTYTVDLCPSCYDKHLAPVAHLLTQYGQPVNHKRASPKSASSPKKPKAVPAQKVPPNAQGEYECDYPNCGKAFSKPQGLGRHKLAHKDYAEFQRASGAAKAS